MHLTEVGQSSDCQGQAPAFPPNFINQVPAFNAPYSLLRAIFRRLIVTSNMKISIVFLSLVTATSAWTVSFFANANCTVELQGSPQSGSGNRFCDEPQLQFLSAEISQSDGCTCMDRLYYNFPKHDLISYAFTQVGYFQFANPSCANFQFGTS
jgi:hypothetical protein